MARATVQMDEIGVRASQDGESVIVGRAAPFGQWSQELRSRNRRFRERIAPTAFDRALAGGDVLALWQHDTSMPLARTRSGTLRLWKSETGLHFEMQPAAETSWGRDALAAVRAGLVDSMSFGFRVSPSGMIEARGDDDVYERTLLDVDLREISIVTHPAYPGTTAQVRSEPDEDDADGEHATRTDGQAADTGDADNEAAAARRLRAAQKNRRKIELASRRTIRVGGNGNGE